MQTVKPIKSVPSAEREADTKKNGKLGRFASFISLRPNAVAVAPEFATRTSVAHQPAGSALYLPDGTASGNQHANQNANFNGYNIADAEEGEKP